MIEVEDLCKCYGRVKALSGVTFTVSDGEVVALLGPNGAGKTTLLKILTGFHFPTRGRAMVNGNSVVEDPLPVKASIGYLAENAPLYGDSTVLEFLRFSAMARGLGQKPSESALERVLSECDLLSVTEKRIDTLSKGFRQRVALAGALIHDPSVLILDEPTTGLDPNQIADFRSLIRTLGERKTILLSTHILQEVEAVCSRVIILNAGTLVAQGSAEAIARECQASCLEEAFRNLTHPEGRVV